MKKLLLVIAALLLWAGPSLAQKTKAQIGAEIITLLPDNTSGQITPLGLRTLTSDIINSIMPTAPVLGNNLACWNGTTGLLQDCGSGPTPTAITALTGDITASGPGSVAATLATAQPGAHTWALGQTFSSAITYGGVTLSNAVTGTGNLPLSASPTFTGTVTMAALNMTGALAITSNSANALAVGPSGTTNPTLQVDSSTGSAVTGLKIAAGASGGGTALSVISSGTNEALGINAKGSGGIFIGSVSTGAVTITPNVTHSGTTTLSAALTYGGVTFNNTVTGSGNLPGSVSPAFTGTPTAPTAAVDTNTTQIATTAMVLAQAASATPLMDGAAAVGTSTRYARGDHVHPTDTTRMPLGGAWTAYTPTFGCGSGTLTTASATGLWQQNGKNIVYTATLTVTTNGSCASFLQIGIPATAQTRAGNSWMMSGADSTAIALSCFIASGATSSNCFKYDSTYPGVSGRTFSVTGTYEVP